MNLGSQQPLITNTASVWTPTTAKVGIPSLLLTNPLLLRRECESYDARHRLSPCNELKIEAFTSKLRLIR
jgi:hypothetical protein